MSQDGDTEYMPPEPKTPNRGIYNMKSLPGLAQSMARFNTSYLQASVSSTLYSKDTGDDDLVTKSKARNQFKIHARKEIGRLSGESVEGKRM